MTKVRTNLGKVATTPKGEYNSATTYVKLDIVTYNGSSYVCLKESVGNLPTDTEYWQLIASKGETGARGQDGQDGYTPIKGVDYFTEEDIASLNIPSKTSDITNDNGFITNTVNDLVNYYLKSETYTKDEVNNIIANIQQFHYEVVQQLPATGESNIMYLVPKSTSQTSNYYDEYVYSNGWEKIGDTEIDLSNYVTITMLNQSLADYTTTANLTTLLNAKQDLLTAGKGVDITNNVISVDIPSEYVYYVENNSQDNPFILSEHKTGLYYFNSKQNDGGYNVYFKVKKNGTSQDKSTAIYIYPNSYFIYYNQVEEDETFSSTKQVGLMWCNFVYKNQRKLYYGNITIQVNNQGAIYLYGQFANNVLSFLNLEETISAKKTFSVLPESSIVPTTDDQLVNKKYVDDNKELINVITSSSSDYLVLSSLERGLYFPSKTISRLYYKLNDNSAEKYLDLPTYSETEYLIVTNKINDIETSGNFGYIVFVDGTTGRRTITPLIANITDETLTMESGFSSLTNNVFLTIGTQTINGRKTFDTQPSLRSGLSPTASTHLTTKKYVDDNIAGIDLSSKQDVLTAGNNITIDENNVISASGNSIVFLTPTNDLSYFSYLNPSSSTDYSLYFKNGDMTTQFRNDFAKALQKQYNNNEKYYSILLFIDYEPILFTPKTDITSKPTSFTFESTFLPNVNNLGDGFYAEYISTIRKISITVILSWVDDTLTVTGQNWKSYGDKIVTINNTMPFTPTKNYHPTNKKYVDELLTTYTGYDATKTQVLKNINGIFTWVDES